MILRRMMQHVKRQDWFAVLLDVVIVVLGVFVGMQVTNWNASQQDHRREAQIVEDLLADLEIDRVHYASGLEAGERRVSAANASLQGAGLAPINFDWAKSPTDVVDHSFPVGGASSSGRSMKFWRISRRIKRSDPPHRPLLLRRMRTAGPVLNGRASVLA